MNARVEVICKCGTKMNMDSGATVNGLEVKPTRLYKRNGKDIYFKGSDYNLICKSCNETATIFLGFIKEKGM